MWVYQSPIGDIYIKRLSNGQYGMIYNDTIWEACDDPVAAADNVYMQVTGCTEWDSFDTTNIDVPSSIHEWEKL